MRVSDLFIGVVTHARSRFNSRGEAEAQATDLARELEERGVRTTVLVSDRDDYDRASFPLSRLDLSRSAVHEASLEHRWRRYLASGGCTPARSAVVDAGYWLAMTAKRVVTADRRTAIRLLNIDLSHLRIMDAAVSDGAPWALIIEDDARVSSARTTAGDLVRLLDFLPATRVQFANLSESVPLEQLGVNGALGKRAVDGGPEWLVEARLPVTNTVCANLYRASFLARIANGIRSTGLVPVAPIDWRLNEQILRLFEDGELGDGSCAWAVPGLFRQASMHDAPN